ncbi:hypothetical protein HMPREF1051_1836 [Neisseria sicca VK64]|uniref:Uncharacterized protein n=1 Tax=Neisseria sicca VK64 TaxID=1095748 RepID=I2NUB1_NEISI|nr:hypothetical protein HMPREF1051_1836 [Neisseria sicca VK64]
MRSSENGSSLFRRPLVRWYGLFWPGFAVLSVEHGRYDRLHNLPQKAYITPIP